MTSSAAPDPTKDNTPPLAEGARRITKRRNRARFAIPKVAFRRLVAEIAAGCKSDLRLQSEGLDALQESAETMVAEHFQRCSQLAELCRLDTIRAEHWHFARTGAAGGDTGPASTLLG
jgi:histone H3/H4